MKRISLSRPLLTVVRCGSSTGDLNIVNNMWDWPGKYTWVSIYTYMQQEEIIMGGKLFYLLLKVITDAPKIGTVS
jgi:hypothetical protein